ncbi:MAG: DUF6680 family protein [Pseudomonadota bacterium]|jgi:hypothetical protein|uniref:DUF6680 family protein n=1 Tax=Sphingomonas ginsenosidimutans TaxID=862134 RepID=UPI0011440BC4|nr:DUF6680 family protein [Sphingomonas ginsenosidimutans]MEE2916503.1 DUF6680 family protein [Pseudomonadota bacterium]
MTADQVQAISAVLTFLAASCAVWATFRAPKLAAEFAEKLRADSQKDDEERRLKLWILTTLMQNRAAIAGPNAVSALNLIDIVFSDAVEVRQAWKHFLSAAEEDPYSADRIKERYLAICEKISRHLGLSDRIAVSDIQAVYYPQLMLNMDEAAYYELQDKIKRFKIVPEASG